MLFENIVIRISKLVTNLHTWWNKIRNPNYHEIRRQKIVNQFTLLRIRSSQYTSQHDQKCCAKHRFLHRFTDVTTERILDLLHSWAAILPVEIVDCLRTDKHKTHRQHSPRTKSTQFQNFALNHPINRTTQVNTINKIKSKRHLAYTLS